MVCDINFSFHGQKSTADNNWNVRQQNQRENSRHRYKGRFGDILYVHWGELPQIALTILIDFAAHIIATFQRWDLSAWHIT